MKERKSLELVLILYNVGDAGEQADQRHRSGRTSRPGVIPQSEISAAFSWIYENIELDQQKTSRAAASQDGSRRVLHDAEKAVLSTESQGYLIQLRELGLLDERILRR